MAVSILKWNKYICKKCKSSMERIQLLDSPNVKLVCKCNK